MTRDHYVAGVMPDFAHAAHRFVPLTMTEPRRRVPVAPRRPLPQWRVERLKARWFAIGCAAGWVPLAVVWLGVRLFGGAA